MNTPVSFELAKLLKEKGFDDFTQIWYQHGEGISGCVEGKRDYYNRKGDIYTSAPTISDVCMWLYEKYNIWISVDPEIDSNTWFHTITHGKSETVFGNYSSLTEAYEKGIEHVLNDMI